MSAQLLTGIILLADKPTQTGPDFGKASPVGLLVVVLLLIGTFVLVWSMNRHLKRLPQSFDPEESEQIAADNTIPAPAAPAAPATPSADSKSTDDPSS